MAQYFRSVPLWAVGVAKLIRDVLIAATAISTFKNPELVLWLVIIRETVGGFVKYSDKFEHEIKPATKRTLKPKKEDGE